MAWPTDDLTGTQLDGGGDSPSSGRSQLYALLVKVKAILAEVTNGAIVFHSALTSVVFNKAAAFNAEYDNGNSSSAKTVAWLNGNKQRLTLTANCTLTFAAPAGPTNVQIKLVQDATGGRTVVWPSAVKWPSGSKPLLAAGANSVDIVTFYYDGTNYYGNYGLDYS